MDLKGVMPRLLYRLDEESGTRMRDSQTGATLDFSKAKVKLHGLLQESRRIAYTVEASIPTFNVYTIPSKTITPFARHHVL